MSPRLASSRPPPVSIEDCVDESEAAATSAAAAAAAAASASASASASPATASRQPANVAAKRSSRPDIAKAQRDAGGSDSGYSSHPQASVAGSSSPKASKKQTSPPAKKGFFSMAKSLAAGATKKGRSSRDEPRSAPPPTAPPPPQTRGAQADQARSALKRTVSRTQKRDNLRIESREDAARMNPYGRIVAVPPQPPPQPDIDADRQRLTRPNLYASAHAPKTPMSAPSQHPIHPIAIPIPVRLRAHTTQPPPRPATFHEGFISAGGYPPSDPAMYYERRQFAPHLTVNTSIPRPPFQQPSATYITTPWTTSPNRQTAYPFAPTMHERSYFPSMHWGPEPYHGQPPPGPHHHPPPPPPPQPHMAPPPHHQQPYQPPPLQRRMSVGAAAGPIVEYPPVRPPTYRLSAPHDQYDVRSRRRLSVPQMESYRGLALGDDESILEDDNEAYYRLVMPPPPVPPRRPSIRHAATLGAQPQRRLERDSTELVSRSPRKYSMDEQRPVSRPPTSSRASLRAVAVESSVPPTFRRTHLQRPVSYHGGASNDLERDVEAYQAAKTGSSRPLHLTTDMVHLALENRTSTKTHKTVGGGGGMGGNSEAGSRASSSRDSEAKRRLLAEKSKASPPEDTVSVRLPRGLKVDLGGGMEGRTISLRQGTDGNGAMEFSISGAATTGGVGAASSSGGAGGGARSQLRSREGRARERERERPATSNGKERKHSVSSRDTALAPSGKELKEIREAGETDREQERDREHRERERERERERQRERERERERERDLLLLHERRRMEISPPKKGSRSRSRVPDTKEKRASNSSADGDVETDITDRLRRFRTASRSRRSSRSAVSARPRPIMAEDQPF